MPPLFQAIMIVITAAVTAACVVTVETLQILLTTRAVTAACDVAVETCQQILLTARAVCLSTARAVLAAV